MKLHRLAYTAWMFISGSAIAADMLPLVRGYYVPVSIPCEDASDQDLAFYYGDNGALSTAWEQCKIKTLTISGDVYTMTDECEDYRTGEVFEGEPIEITIVDKLTFRFGNNTYRYCGENRGLEITVQ